jgi:hypothetical protein
MSLSTQRQRSQTCALAGQMYSESEQEACGGQAAELELCKEPGAGAV